MPCAGGSFYLDKMTIRLPAIAIFMLKSTIMKIYHNPRCRKSREALNLLEERNLEFETIEYLKTPPSKEELTAILAKLGISAFDLIRKGEAEYKEHFKGKELSEDDWVDAMVQYPRLIERPIVVKGDKAVVGRPLEQLEHLLND